jgi:thiol:disulfide interchange protein
LIIGGTLGCAVALVAILAVGGFLLLRMSQDAVVSMVFAPAMATSAPGAARTPAPTAVPRAQLYNPRADARQEIVNALALAEADEKLVLIDFGADWCADCVVLSRLLDDSTVKPYLDAHYVVVRVDVGQWDNNLDISKEYGDPIARGIPAVVVLRPDAEVVASTGGGELANARTASEDDILTLLQQWAEGL